MRRGAGFAGARSASRMCCVSRRSTVLERDFRLRAGWLVVGAWQRWPTRKAECLVHGAESAIGQPLQPLGLHRRTGAPRDARCTSHLPGRGGRRRAAVRGLGAPGGRGSCPAQPRTTPARFFLPLSQPHLASFPVPECATHLRLWARPREPIRAHPPVRCAHPRIVRSFRRLKSPARCCPASVSALRELESGSLSLMRRGIESGRVCTLPRAAFEQKGEVRTDGPSMRASRRHVGRERTCEGMGCLHAWATGCSREGRSSSGPREFQRCAGSGRP